MPSLDILNCEIGTVSSRQDHSCAFRVITPELRPSEAGVLMGWHGRVARVTIHPHEGAPDEVVSVTTERDSKTPGQRIRAILFLLWKQDGMPGTFDAYYLNQTEKIIEHLKSKLPQP